MSMKILTTSNMKEINIDINDFNSITKLLFWIKKFHWNILLLPLKKSCVKLTKINQ